MRRDDIKYQQEFGNIPDTIEERCDYILGKRINNEKLKEDIINTANKIKKIKWKILEFTMWKIVKPSARPRAKRMSGFLHMYVPRAKENGDWFAEFAKENKLPIIETPCYININVYSKTPNSFNTKNKVLSELKIIRPWGRTGDIDNYAKSVLDAIQHGMLSDDCLVIDTTVKKYYSCKPHADIFIKYMERFPEY